MPNEVIIGISIAVSLKRLADRLDDLPLLIEKLAAIEMVMAKR